MFPFLNLTRALASRVFTLTLWGAAILCFLLAGRLALAQGRLDSYDASRLQVRHVTLWPLADGGCAAQWCGYVTSEDGGHTLEGCSPEVELKVAVQQNRCEGLRVAGFGRLGRALRFDVDAGSP